MTTPRLTLRPLTVADAVAVHSAVVLSRTHLLPFMPWARDGHADVEETAAWLRGLAPPGGATAPEQLPFGMFERTTGELLGVVGLDHPRPLTAAAELSWWVRADHIRRGLATEAVRHLVSQSLRPLPGGGWGLRRLHADVAAANVASAGVARRVGLRREARLRQATHVAGLGVDDRLIFAVLADEWDDEHHRRRSADPPAGLGVGPHPRPWPDDERLDPLLLRDGDRRNVADRYRYWSVEAVRADLAARAQPFHVAIENWRHDLNIGTIVRTANAFGAAAVHIVGRRAWNRRGAMVTDRYLDIRHHRDVAALGSAARSEGLQIVGVDNLPGSVSLLDTPLPRRCLLLFGQEGPGLSAAARGAASAVVHIPQSGSTRSINAGVASGIAMAEWLRQHARD